MELLLLGPLAWITIERTLADTKSAKFCFEGGGGVGSMQSAGR